jgi:hypothetical protein
MFLQPFVADQLKHPVTLTVDTESTFDGEAASGQRSAVPIIGLISKVTSSYPERKNSVTASARAGN